MKYPMFQFQAISTSATPSLPLSVIEWKLNEINIEILLQSKILALEMLPRPFSYIKVLMAYKYKSSRKEAFSRDYEKVLDPLILVHPK